MTASATAQRPGAAHEALVLGREGDHHPSFDDDSVLKSYSELTGYEGTEATDQGTEPRQLAQFRRKTGILDAGGGRHRIGAYLWLERGDVDQLWAALHAFGVAGIGYELPESAEQQFSEGKPWDVVRGAPIAGGHYVPAIGRRSGVFIDGEIWAFEIHADPPVLAGYGSPVIQLVGHPATLTPERRTSKCPGLTALSGAVPSPTSEEISDVSPYP